MTSVSKSSTVQSLQRALSLLNFLAQSKQGMNLKDVAAASELPPSTAHRLLSTLLECGYVQTSSAQRWSVGVQAFSVGQSFLDSRDLLDLVRGPMIRLMEETQETVKMGILSGNQAVILTQSECSQSMRAFAEPGARLPLHCTSLGKAFLACLDQDAVEDIVGTTFTAQTAKTHLNIGSLWDDLAQSKKRGFAVQDEEYLVGLRGAAACIYDEDGKAIAALSVTGPTVRIPTDRLDQLGRVVSGVCRNITQQYGGKIPSALAA